MQCVLFEDSFTRDSGPLVSARPAFAVTCGVSILYEAARRRFDTVGTVMRDYLAPVCNRSFPADELQTGPTLYVNASLVPDAASVRRLAQLADRGEGFMATHGDRVAAALLPDGPLPDASPENVASRLLETKLPLASEEMPTIDYPFDVVKYHLEIFERNLGTLIESGRFTERAKNVYVGKDVSIAETAVLHAEEGPIVLDDNARVMDFAYLMGPLYVGKGSRIIERSSVKEHVAVGHTCKIGGEVEASIIEDYSNKQHHGFLGHSYVGSWVNLGAGTSNSDLKNTYGEVRVGVGGRVVPSGMQFFGCVIGDYSKAAINTSIFTGKVIGVCAVLYGFVTTNVPSFCNYARSFGQVSEVSIETALQMQKRMFKRRDVVQTPEDEALLRAVYEATRDERGMAAEPLSL